MTDRSRLRCKAIADKAMSAEDAAAFVAPGDHVGMSGFTGSGHPKAVPAALVGRVTEAAARGDRFTISVWTGSSTAPELDGVLAAADGIELRMPYQSDPGPAPRSTRGRWTTWTSTCPTSRRWCRRLLRQPRRRAHRGRRHHRGRRADPVLLGGQQQDLARHGRQGHPRGQLVAARRAGGHARHLLRHRAAPAPQADRDPRALRPDRRALPALDAGQDRRRRPDARPGLQPAVQAG